MEESNPGLSQLTRALLSNCGVRAPALLESACTLKRDFAIRRRTKLKQPRSFSPLFEMTMNVAVVFVALLSVAFGQLLSPAGLQNACLTYNSNNEYCGGPSLVAACQDSCTLSCTVETTTIQPYTYYNNYDDLPNCQNTAQITVVTDTTYTYPLNLLEPCGTSQICVNGNCVPINATIDAECKKNFGSGAVGVQSVNPCQLSCLEVVMAPQYPYSTQEVSSVESQDICVPDGTLCGNNGLCFNGDCFTAPNLPTVVSC